MGLRAGRSSLDFLNIRPFSTLHRDILSWRLSVLLLALVALFSYAPNALAIEGLPISVEAFGTLGLAKSNSDDAYFRNSYIQAKGVDDSWSHNIDSNLGIQVSLEPSEKFSATIQSLLEMDADGNFEPNLEWCYLAYKPNENLSIRVGRTKFPTFMASDYSSVGFAYLPLRLPQDVYSLVPFSGVDGIDIIYETNIGSYYLQAQGLAAKRNFDIYNDARGKTHYELSDVLGFRLSLTRGNWTLSAGYLRGEMKTDVPEIQELAQALRPVAPLFPPFGELADELSNDGKTSFTSLGLQYSGYRFSFTGEYVQRRWDINMNVTDTNAYYLLAGYRFGKWTPYASYSESHNKSDMPINSYPTSGPLAPLTAAIDLMFGPLLGDSRTKAIGLRYDLLEKVAIKVQYEKIDRGATLFLSKDNKPLPDEIKLLSVALSFVY